MREIRQSGSEGGGGSIPLPTPIEQPQAGTETRGAAQRMFSSSVLHAEPEAALSRWTSSAKK